jgi:hypothetical protein
VVPMEVCVKCITERRFLLDAATVGRLFQASV